MKGRFGNASQWFTFGFSFFAVGIAAFAGSYNGLASLRGWLVTFRFSGVAFFVVGLAIIVVGLFVWRYNDKRSDAPTVLVAESSPTSDERASLSRTRDELLVQKAGLEILVRAGRDADARRYSKSSPTRPYEIEQSRKWHEAKVRLAQVEAQIAAENMQLRTLEKRSTRDPSDTLSAVGNSKTMTFDGEAVFISPNRSLRGSLSGGRSVQIPLQSILIVEWSDASPSKPGYLRLNTSGAALSDSRGRPAFLDAVQDTNSVVFKRDQTSSFGEIRDAIEVALSEN